MKRFWIASFPRSGNTLMRLLLEHHLHIETISDKDQPGIMDKGVIAARKGRVFDPHGIKGVKTHAAIPPGKEKLPAILIVRHPMDVLVSYAHFLSGDGTPDFARAMRELDKWSSFYEQWLRFPAEHFASDSQPRPTVVYKYEKLVRQKQDGDLAAIGLACDLMGILRMDIEIKNYENLEVFDELHAEHPRGFRKGEVGSWRDELPITYQREVTNRHRRMMERLGYV